MLEIDNTIFTLPCYERLSPSLLALFSVQRILKETAQEAVIASADLLLGYYVVQ